MKICRFLILVLFALFTLALAGCGGDDEDSPLAPTVDVNSAVLAEIAPIEEVLENGEDASVDNVTYEFVGSNSVIVTYDGYLDPETELTVSGVLTLVRTITGTRVTLSIVGAVTLEGGTVARLVWDAAATGDYDEEEDDFADAPDEWAGTITADGTEYRFSVFKDLFTGDDGGGDDPSVTDPRFVVSGMVGTVVYSANGSAWGWPNVAETDDTGVTVELRDIASDANGLAITVGSGGTILRSTDGVHWSELNSGITGDLTTITWSAGRWVTFVNASTVYYSDDGLTWSPATVTNGTPDTMYDVAGDGAGGFIAAGSTYTTMVSTDNGETWTLIEPFHDNFHNYRGIASDGNTTWVAVGDAGMIAVSHDTGQNWVLAGSGMTTALLQGVAHGAGRFIAVGRDAASLFHSTDGDTWVNDTGLLPAEFTSTGNPLTDLATDGGGRWSVLGGYGDHLLSVDNGASWTVVALDGYGAWAICYRP